MSEIDSETTLAVALDHRDGVARVVAARAIRARARILVLHGDLVATPSRHSVQIDLDRHLALDPTLAADAPHGVWRYLNHSCAPNAVLRGLELRSLRAIAAGDEITFDYLTTEFELAAPFRCDCGAADCVGEIRGYRHLTAAQRRKRAAHCAPHLLHLRERER